MNRPLSRRDLLRSGAALPLAMGLPTLDGSAGGRSPEDGADNIIFMVSDGMSAGVPSLAEPFSRLVRGRGTHWQALAGDPRTVRGLLRTGSLSSMVTDSSAASSAWGSGSPVFNGAVNVLPDGTPLMPLAALVRGKGKAVGLVTTTTITHATPAGFAAVERDRFAEDRIAPQYLDQVDVALGGGAAHFRAASRGDGVDLAGAFRQRGYTLCTSGDELHRAGAGQRLLGLFAPGHLPYTIDQRRAGAGSAGVPTLAEMTRAALRCLEAAPGGFLLQVEGGRVDHAAHGNDAAALLWDQLAFDDALGEVLDFLARHPETLLVVTTDHGNANPGLNGRGLGYADSNACFERLAGIDASFSTMYLALSPRATAAEVVELVRARTQITLTAAEAEAIAGTRRGERTDDLNDQHTGFAGALGQALGNHMGIAWTGTSHTSELALTLAAGPGRGHLAGVLHHADLFPIMTGLFGITHRNPRMSPEQAAKLG